MIDWLIGDRLIGSQIDWWLHDNYLEVILDRGSCQNEVVLSWYSMDSFASFCRVFDLVTFIKNDVVLPLQKKNFDVSFHFGKKACKILSSCVLSISCMFWSEHKNGFNWTYITMTSWFVYMNKTDLIWDNRYALAQFTLWLHI